MNHFGVHLDDLHGRESIGTSGAQNSSGYILPDFEAHTAVRVSVFCPHSSHWNQIDEDTYDLNSYVPATIRSTAR